MKNLKRIWKKGVAFLLAATMSLSMLPVTALAVSGVDGSGLRYDPTTGQVTGQVTVTGAITNAPLRVTIISDTKPRIGNSDYAGPSGGTLNSYRNGESAATGTLPLIQFDILNPSNGVIDLSTISSYVSAKGNTLGTVEEFKALCTGRYSNVTDKFTYKVFVFDNNTNTYVGGDAFDISLSAAAELKASPDPVIFSGTGTETITLTNLVTGTTATNVKATVADSGMTVMPGSGGITGINGAGGTVATSGTFVLENTSATNRVTTLTITYDDSSAGAQTPITVQVIVAGTGTFTAEPIIITQIGGTGTTGIATGNPNAAAVQARVDSRSVSGGFALNASAGWSNGTNGIYDLFKTAAPMRGTEWANHTFEDSLSVTHDGVSALIEVTQAEITAGTATPSGYVTVMYAQGTANTIAQASRNRVLQVPIYYVPASTPTEPVITFNAGGGTLSDSATPTVSGGKVAVGDIPTATRSGYKFLGWSGGTLTNATAAQVAAVTHSADTTYTAQWEQQYRVTYNSNLPAGASVSNMPTSPSAYLDKGSNYTLVGTPSCSGATDGHAYKFKGWGATANATTTITAINNISKDETVYAIWEALPQVTFKIGTGGKFSDNTTADKKVNANASGAVTAPAVTANTGYSFKGWSDGTNTLTEAQVNAKNHTADTTYTAQWELRKVTSGTPDANNNLVEGSTISLEKVTLSDGTDIAKASYASSDLANFEWYIVNSGVTPVPGTHTPVQSNDKTGNYLIPTGTAPTQHVWVLVKGGGTNISDEPCLIDMGPVGVESFTYEVEIHVSGSKPATVPNGLTASLSTTNLEAGKSYGVTASVGGNSANKYKFSGWSDSLTSGSSFNPAAGSVSVYSVPATTTGTGLVSKPGKNYIYANFVPIPHLTLTNSGGATGAQAFRGQLGNDGKDSARNVTYTFPAGSKFTASTTPGDTVAVGAGTAGNLVIECTETAPGTYTDTLTITYEDADGVKYTLTQPVAYTVTVPTKTVHVEVAVDGGSASDTLPANTTVSPTKANPVTLEGGDSTLLSTNTSNRGYRFTGWSAVAAANGSLSTTAAATNNGGTTTFIMADPVPSTDVTVVANYITVPWLEAGSKIPGGHATGTSPTVKPATVEINNTGAANATAVEVSVDDHRFQLASGGMTATGNTVAAGGNGTVLVKPKTPAGLAAGTYVIPVTVTYKQVGSDATELKVETTVTYVVTETTYTLTVKYPTGANSGVSNVQYILNGGTATAIANNGTVTVKPADVVTITATLTDCTGSWATTACTENVDTGSVLGISTFTGNATATLSVTGKAKLTYEPTAGAATEGAATVTTNPALKISNVGTGNANITKITVTNNNASDSKTFGGSTSTAVNLAAGANHAITLAPNNWGSAWAAGTYTAKVTVEYTDSSGSHTDVTYVPFIVSAPSTFTGKVTVLWNNSSTLGSNVTGVSLTGNPAGTQSGNVWTFANLSSASAYSITVATPSGNVTSTQTLNNGNQEVTIYLSAVSVASADGSQGSVTLAGNATPLTKAYEAGQAVVIAAVPASTYKFDKWQKGSTDANLGQSATVLAEKTNTTYTAYFTQDFKVTYDGNGAGVSNVPVDQNSYKRDATVTVSTTVPTRPGYQFDGWYSAATGGTKFGDTFTITTDTTLYAHWTAVRPTEVASITESTVVHYGDSFSSNAVATAVRGANANVPFTYSDKSAAKLASIGLSLDASGNISGRPYKVGTFTFTIWATDTRNNAYTDVSYTLTVKKAQPTLTASVASGNQTGSAFSAAKYNYTVTAPLYTAFGWQNATLMTGTGATLTATAADKAGTVSLDAPTTLFENSAKDIGLTYAPGSKTDGASNAYTAIYENAATTLSVAGTGVVEALSISPNTHDFGSVEDNGSQITQTNYTQPAAFTYTVKNEGNVTTGAITITAPAGYTITTALSKSTLAPGETATFALQPNNNLSVGKHPGVVSASYTSTQTGTPTISASAGADFEVKAPAIFSGYITVKTQAVGATAPSVSALPDDYVVSLRPVGGGAAVGPIAQSDVATTGRYRFENADATKEYNIVVTKSGTNADSWTVPDRLVSLANRTNQGLILYELKTADDGTSGVTTTGDGYYLAGVGVTITATASAGNMAFDKWTEVTAQSSPNATSYSNNAASTSYAMPAQSATLTANYKNTDATECTITYDANRPGDVKNDVNIWTPGPETGVAVGTAHTLLTGTPTLLGYTFEGWFAAPTGGTAITSVTPAGDTTVYAHWTPVALTATGTAPDGTYGTGYTGGKVSVTTPSGATATYKVTAGALPGGLTLDENTGAITGIPYEICTNKPVTVTVTMSNDVNTTPRTTTVDLTITINHATPTITGVTATNVVTGADPSTHDYVVTVAGPKYTGTGWETAVDELVYTPGTPAGKQSGIGDAAFSASGSNVKVDFTPANTAFDGENQAQDAVWTIATKTVSVSPDSNKVTLTVDPTEWEFDSNGNTAGGTHAQEGFTAGSGTDGLVASNVVNPKEFTLKNEGNVPSGTLSYKFASAAAAGQPGTYFSFAWGTATAAGLGANASGTFTVSVNATATAQAGTYTDTLTISNTAGDSATVYRLVFVVEKSATYTGTVTVYVTDVTPTAPNNGTTKTQIPAAVTGGKVEFVPSDGGAAVTATWDAAGSVYKSDALETGKGYSVRVTTTGGAWTVPGSIANDGDNVDVKLYQVQLASAPAGLTVTQTGAGYYAENQPAALTTGATATGAGGTSHAFKTWDDANSTTAASFNAVITDAVKFTATYEATLTLTYDANGGTGDAVSGGNPEAHNAGDKFSLKNCTATKDGYTFDGWDTQAGGTGTRYQAGATYTMPDTSTTLYAIWKANDAMSLPGNSWTVAYKDTLGDKVINAVGGIPGYTYAKDSGSLPTGFSFDAANHKFSGTASSYSTTVADNSKTMTVTATDSVGKTANGSFTITVTQADTKVTTGFTAPGTNPSVGDTVDPSKLGNKDNVVVNYYKTDGTTVGGDIDAVPGTGGTAPEGTWTVEGPDKYLPGENTYVLKFTPTDPGFKPCTTTVTVTAENKKINSAEIGIFFPANGGTPNTTVSGDNGKKIAATTTPTVATPTDTFKVDNISWAPADKFDSKNDSTVYVQLTAEDGWEFDAAFVGSLTDQTATSAGTKTATVIGNTGKTLTLMYVFKGEDQVVDDIYVETTAELKVDGTDSKLIGMPAEALKYTVKSTDYHWETTDGHVRVDADNPFKADTLYDAVVKVTANEGYKFNTANFGTAQGDDIHEHAKIDNGVPGEGDKTNKVEIAMSADGKSITIRFSAFKPVALRVVGIRVTEGALTTTDYYAITATDKNAAGNDVKTTTDGVYGHSAHSAQYSDAGKASIKYVLVYEDGSESTPISYTNETLVYGTSASGNLSPMPADGYTFTVEDPAVKDDVTEYDGKNVYLSYTVSGKTYYAAQPVGTLTVRHLIADQIVPSRVWTTAELTFVKGAQFTLPSTNVPTADVAFNTRDILLHSETGFTYAQTPANGGNQYFYSTDVSSAAAAKTAELKAGVTMADADNGKTVYMCYIDINGNLVYAPVGVLKVSGDTNIKVWISNTSDPTDNGADVSSAKPGATTGGSTEPEYGETIKANVEGTPDGNLTYTWKDATTGDVLQTGPSDTYVLGKDDVGKTITVIVTESGTSGSTETVNKPVGQRRTLKLDVIHVSKVYDGTVTNTHTYKTTSTANDFTLSNVINGDVVYVSAYTATAPEYEAASVGSTFDWPAISDATRGNYTLSDGDHYRLGNQAALPDRGEIVGDDTINPITVKNDDIQPVRGGKPTDTPFTKPADEDRYDVDPTEPKGTWYWKDGETWKPVADGGLDDEGNFKPSTTYKVVVEVEAEDGKKFADSADGYYDIGGRLWPAEVEVTDDQTGATLTVEFPPTAAPEGDINVTYVTAFFQDPPIVDETVPAHPDWVGREVETVSTTVNDSNPEHFVVRWYESSTKPDASTNWGTPLVAGSTFKAGKYYKVEVDVKPGNGYAYNLDSTDDVMDTKFAINTSAGTNDATAVKNGDSYTMSYVFATPVAPIEIAHVNLSVPQPVVEGKPADHSTVTVNQALGTNGTNYNATLNVTNVTWSTTDAFEADTVYTLEFDVTTGTYDYLNETADKVDFIVGGVGPIEGADSATGTGAITQVETTATDADKTYHVKVTFGELKGGKVTLTDVYVNATVPATDKSIDAGYKPFVDAVKPYELTGANDIWQYWNNTGWETITDANKAAALDGEKFKAGVPYQVIGTVRMKTDTDSAKYVIDDTKTKFYLAGIECTDTPENAVAGTGTYTPLVKNAGDPATYTLTRQFLIPVDKIITEVTSHASIPAVGGVLTGTPYTDAVVDLAINGSGNILTSRVTAGTVTWKVQDGGNWVNVPGNTVEQGKVYQATYTLTTDTANGYTYKDDTADNAQRVKFTIHGVEVTGEGTKTQGGYTVTTVRNSDSSYTVTVVYPETSSDTKIAQVTVDYTVPVAGANPAVDKQYTQHEQVSLKHDALVTDDSHGSTWHEGNKNGSVIGASETFGNGDYTVVATFKANDGVDGKPGFVFDSETAFIVNGNSYKASDANTHVTLSADKKTATVWHTFPGLDKEIVKVVTSVTAPVAGAVPQTKADTPVAANKANTNLQPDALTIGNVTWTKTAGGAHTGAFDYSTAYTATYTLTVNSGDGYNYLADTAASDYVDFLVNSNTAVVNVNDTANNSHTTTYADGTVVTLTKTSDTVYTVKIDFPATDAKVDKILTVNVNTTVPPEHKLRVPDVYIVSTEPYTNPADPAKTDLVWKVKGDDGNWTVVAKDTPFEAGKEYMAEGKVVLKNPTTTTWNITEDTRFYLGGVAIPATTATGSLNDTTGGSVSYTTGFAADKTAVDGIYPKDTEFTVSLTFRALADKTDPTIVKVAANVQQPIANQSIPSGAASLLLALNKDGVDMSAYVTPSTVTWTEKNADGNFVAPTGTTFRTGGSYQAEFTLTATDAGHKYVAVADPKDYLDLLINGVTHTDKSWLEGATDTETVGADGTINQIKVEIAPSTPGSEATSYKVTVTFNNISDKADVLAVLGTAKVPEAKATISDNDIDALPGQVYEKQSARWLDKNGDPVTETNFKPGNTYTAELTVKIKDAEKPYYRFKETTTGLLNGSGATVVTRDPATGEPTTITLKLTFEVPKEVVKVHVASNRPAVGDQTVVNDTNKSINKSNATEDRYDLGVVGNVDGTDLYGKWYTDAGCTIPATQFEEEKTYYMQVEVTPGEDYALTEEPGDYTWDTNRQNANSVKKVGDKYVAVFEYTIRKAGEKTPNELAVTVTPPVAGNNVDKVGKPGNDDTTVKGDVKWTDGSGNEVNKFDYSTTYTATVVVEPKDPNNFDFTAPEFKLNGVTPTAKENLGEDGQPDGTYTLTYTFPPTSPKETVTVPSGGGGGGGGTVELPQVFYKLGEVGVTDDLTAEKVKQNGKPSKVPKVEGLTIKDKDGSEKTYTFIGWSETDPAKTTGTPVLVDPTTFKISKDKTFYAVYEIKGHTAIDHTHYVIGFPDGTFGPSADITRGEVATIIARACLDGFIEGANYGNPGGYSDVERHWAYSAISYCTVNSVFTGYTDGTFRPDQPITRQELATVVARLHGLIANQGVPFTDADQISKWAVDGVYTAYAKGWINGYKDGSFKPLQNITRAETVKVFNGYLGRGVDVKGLEEMREYVHSGVASNNQENGYDQYMTWPDVPKTHWAYYEIIEAANDHTFYWLDETNPVPPEHWSSVWIDEVWRYHDSTSDGARPTNPDTDTPSY